MPLSRVLWCVSGCFSYLCCHSIPFHSIQVIHSMGLKTSSTSKHVSSPHNTINKSLKRFHTNKQTNKQRRERERERERERMDGLA